LGINVDGIAPAGAISSTAVDMTAWLRFLLRQGVQNGKALISPAALTTTWTPQILILSKRAPSTTRTLHGSPPILCREIYAG
jgi:CubicO group peptidase (beta-lactamase class C family)